MHPAGPLFLQYARYGCLVDVRQRWTKAEIKIAVERGGHKLALEANAIAMMHAEAASKVKDRFAELVYLDKIDHLMETKEWEHLKISPIAMVPHKLRKYRAILDLLFSLKLFGMEIPSVNENTSFTAPQHSMQQMGKVLP